MSTQPYQFQTKAGVRFPGVSPVNYRAMCSSLQELGIQPSQIAEAASYSMAMIVRYALGLNAQGGHVCCVVEDSLEGCIALATLRHLVNGGSLGAVITLSSPQKVSPEFALQLLPLSKMGLLFHVSQDIVDNDEHHTIISKSHNVIFGVSPNSESTLVLKMIELLNEAGTPVHTVGAPHGLDLATGTKSPHVLFASSTLSLGAPQQGLNPGADCVGRHYLADISFTKQMYEAQGIGISSFFAEQPVLQIFPVSETTE